jgi:predicted nucleic acid-binding Zn ribbon protein
VSDHGYWQWRDEELAHPGGRAAGGEPCVVCEQPVPPNAHWKHRDRHACSSKCNYTLSRRFNRKKARGELAVPQPVTDPYATRPPLVFATDLDLEFPYAFLGLSPRPGDVVDRHGSSVLYERVHLPSNELRRIKEQLRTIDDPNERTFRWDLATRSTLVHHLQTGAAMQALVDDNDTLSRTMIRQLLPNGDEQPIGTPFEAQGQTWKWHTEWIRDVEADDTPLTWHAWVCLPHPAPSPWETTMWSPAYAKRSERLRRTSASTSRHARRMRMVGPDGTIEPIDPVEVYCRDNWTCQLCNELIDATLTWPDPGSASLDHIIPLAALGSHTYDNVQAAHLGCNIRKGARVTTTTS